MTAAETASNAPMLRKILMTVDPIGGVWSYALTLSRELSRRGVEVVMASMGARMDASQRRAAHAISGLTLYESDFALEWMDDPWRDVDRAGRWLLEIADVVKPDIAHLNGFSHAALDWPVPVLVVAHSCVASWWRAVYRAAAPERFAEYGVRVRRALSKAALVVAPSIAMLRMLEAEHGPVTLSRVIANASDSEVFRPLDKGDFYLACARLWDLGKNAQALSEIADRLPWKMRVAGDRTPPRGGSRRLSGSLELLGRLSQSELAYEMGRAKVFVHPARYEPFGLAPLEAALCGCALVLGDIESLREVWGNAALYVPPDDPRAMEGALARLSRDADMSGRLSALARARALELSPHKMADAYLAAYSRVGVPS